MDLYSFQVFLLIMNCFFPYALSSFRECNDYNTTYDCYINNCNWENLNDTCVNWITRQNYTINVSLPQNISFGPDIEFTDTFPNCTRWEVGDHRNATTIKCSWLIKELGIDKHLSIKLIQKEIGNYILGFSAKYMNGNKKNYWYTTKATNKSNNDKIDLGADIEEIVIELFVINDKWKHEIFTAEINAWHWENWDDSGGNHEYLIVAVLIIFNAFFIFFIVIFLFNTIYNYCRSSHNNRNVFFNKHFWKKSKKLEVWAFCNKRMPVLSWKEIMKLNEKQIYGNACSLCLEDFKQNEELCKIECNHIFHRTCIQNWMLEEYINPYCPNCHTVIFQNDLNNNNTHLFGRVRKNNPEWETVFLDGKSAV